MELYHFVWVLAGITGLTAAGIMGNGWAIATGETPTVRMLASYAPTTPLRIIALVIYAPLGVTKAALDDLDHNPPFALMVLAVGLLWSFLQGVFILTTFFGFT